MDRILIGYLNDGRRMKHLNYMCKFLSQSTYCDKYTIIVLSSENTTQVKCKEVIEKYNINYVLSICHNDYMPKIKEFVNYAISNNYTHCFKMDNDIILPSFIFDYIISELPSLSEDVGILLPTLYTSSPSCEYFIEDFLDTDEKEIMYGLFEQYRYTDEFSVINDSYPQKWTLQGYSDMVEKMKNPNNGVYKAIHPIRYSSSITRRMNDYAIKHNNYFFNQEKTPYIYTCDFPYYFMPQTFIMKTELLSKVMDPSLAYDDYDEVTLNRLIRREGKKISFIRNCFGIHIAHNGHMKEENFMEYEEKVLDIFFKNT
jgi:hypothetical protein